MPFLQSVLSQSVSHKSWVKISTFKLKFSEISEYTAYSKMGNGIECAIKTEWKTWHLIGSDLKFLTTDNSKVWELFSYAENPERVKIHGKPSIV